MKLVSRKCKHTEENFIGRKFGRLTVLAYDKQVGEYRYWMCRCSCGKEKSAPQTSLLRGDTKSCGCISIELGKTGDIRRVHGMRWTPIYYCWQNMRRRCSEKNNIGYKDYGGRGIKVCSSWGQFVNFYKDMGASWKKGLTIERKNNNGDYCKGNCVWIPRARQSVNTRKNVYVVYKGIRMCIADAARSSGIKYGTIKSRLRWRCPTHLLFLESHHGRTHRSFR